MRFIFIYFTSIQFNKKFKNNISPKFNSKDYSKLFISDQFNSKFNSKLWNWLDSIQQNIHSIWKCGYRSGLVRWKISEFRQLAKLKVGLGVGTWQPPQTYSDQIIPLQAFADVLTDTSTFTFLFNLSVSFRMHASHDLTSTK